MVFGHTDATTGFQPGWPSAPRAARCSRHNFVFIEGLKAPLLLDPEFKDGFYDAPPTRGMRAAARVFAGWGFSQAFLRQRLDMEAMGYGSLEDFITQFWEGDFLGKDANNILSMMWSWQHGDIAANALYDGDYDLALSSIVAKAIVNGRSFRPSIMFAS